MIRVEACKKSFGDLEALKGVSLSIPEGEFFGLLGPNGAGKSTFMNILSGYLDATEGIVEIDGQTVSQSAMAVRQVVGLVPQSVALYEELSAESNLHIFGRLYGLAGKDRKGRVDAILERVRLTDRRKDIVKTFSGGMKRRLNIAASLLHEPKVLLCDEPTVGVDPQSRNAIFDFLEELREEGLTVIYTTHYMEEAQRLCDRIGIIDHGEVIALGSLDELLTKLPFEASIAYPVAMGADGADGLAEAFGSVETVGEVRQLKPEPGFRLSRFFARVEEAGLPERRFQIKQPTLEDLFLHLTGRSLRE